MFRRRIETWRRGSFILNLVRRWLLSYPVRLTYRKRDDLKVIGGRKEDKKVEMINQRENVRRINTGCREIAIIVTGSLAWVCLVAALHLPGTSAKWLFEIAIRE
jgi:hypothetical protein